MYSLYRAKSGQLKRQKKIYFFLSARKRLFFVNPTEKKNAAKTKYWTKIVPK